MKRTIPEMNLPSFKAKIAELNKKAEKLGCEGITYSVSQAFIRKVDGYDYAFVDVTVDGESPQLNGWNVKAMVDFTLSSNVVSKFSDFDATWLFDVKPVCQHCGKKRNRNFTYLLQKDSEELLVGKSCLKDFTGHQNPNNVLGYSSILREFEESIDEDEKLFDSGGANQCIFVESYLASVLYVVKQDGDYYSKSRSMELGITSTADIALSIKISAGEREPLIPEAQKVIEFVNASVTGKNEFELNLLALVKEKFVRFKHAGILAYAVQLYRQDAARKAKESVGSGVNEFVGEVGSRLDLVLTFVDAYRINSDEYVLFINKMVDSEGRTFVWLTGKVAGEPNTKYKVRGTVKRHEDYHGVKQTHLSRCKVENA